MKYMGSKARIAKYILPIILKDRKDGQCYVEPFVGGANMIDKVNGWRIAADFNPHVVAALNCIKNGLTPKSNMQYSETDYNKAAKAAREGLVINDVDSYALIAFSFGAKWIGGWSRGKNANGMDRDYVAEQYRASGKQMPLLQGVELISASYSDLNIPKQSIVYCDPPYANTTNYKDDFDHEPFWQWCRDKVRDGHKVFISEYNAPDDFECVWKKEHSVSVAKQGKHKKSVEKLFVHKSQL